VWGVKKWLAKIGEGVGVKAIKKAKPIGKYNQKLGFALVYLYDNALQLITSKAITQSINTRRNNMNAITKQQYKFLIDLRDSGEINMFGAGPYLEAEFDLDRREARQVLQNWMGWMQDREDARKEIEVEAYYNQ
jgi:hypothetical protein